MNLIAPNLIPLMFNIMMIFIISIPLKNNKFNPITLMFLLILLIFSISNKMNLFINSWSSMILFLIMIGGLMVIFMYIISLANNELFIFNYKYIFINSIKIIPLIMMTFYLLFNNLMYLNWNNSNIWYNSNLLFSINLNFYELYSFNFKNKMFFIMTYLFYSMICIMNICYKLKLPLRQLYF